MEEQSTKIQGFTLIELSIALVIIGLIVSSILVGRDLIRQAELRSITRESAEWMATMHTFRSKYFALPGDMVDASSYWGEVNSVPATCMITLGAGTATCNGNNDGRITGVAPYDERHRAWQQLANAGLIKGTYSGIGGSAGISNHVARVNAPPSNASSRSGWMMNYAGTYTGDLRLFDGDYGHVVELMNAVDGVTSDYEVLLPIDMLSIDIKTDDGKPAYGRLRCYKDIENHGCTTSDTASLSEYNTTYTLPACGLFFLNAF